MIFQRSIIAVLLVFAVFSQTVRGVVIVGAFEINRDYYAESLCVKRTEENNCCKGSCQLEIQIEKTSEQEGLQSLMNSWEVSIYYFENSSTSIPEAPVLESNSTCFLQPLDCTSYPASVFHPPRISA